jgi:hypothetical protein
VTPCFVVMNGFLAATTHTLGAEFEVGFGKIMFLKGHKSGRKGSGIIIAFRIELNLKQLFGFLNKKWLWSGRWIHDIATTYSPR